jgi:hypothetical protein
LKDVFNDYSIYLTFALQASKIIVNTQKEYSFKVYAYLVESILYNYTMSSNTIPMDLNYEKLRLLLKRLSQGVIDIDEAEELRLLLETERVNAIRNKDYIYEDHLSKLINIIDSFIADEFNLQMNP